MIVVSGDSFAWGSWGERTFKYGEIAENVPNHLGLAHFLIQTGHEVDIVSKPGSGFYRTFKFLKFHVERNPPEKIYHFMTDSFRTDHDNYPWPENKKFTLENIKKEHAHRKRKYLKHLNSLGIPCVVIGALTTVYQDDIIDLPNLSLGCSNMFETVDPTFKSWEIYFDGISREVIGEHEVDETVVSYLEDSKNLWTDMYNTKYVGDDGHPSPLSWEKLYLNLLSNGHIYKGDYKKIDEKTFIKLENEKQVLQIREWHKVRKHAVKSPLAHKTEIYYAR